MELIKVYKIRPFQPVDEIHCQVGPRNPGRLVAMGRQHGAISYAKMCELSELSELSVLLFRFRRGEVCALSALCAISPPFELKGDGTTAFQVIQDVLPPRPGRCPVILWCQVVKELCIVRGRLGALLLIAQSSAQSAAPPLGAGIQSGRRGQSVLFNKCTAYEGREMMQP